MSCATQPALHDLREFFCCRTCMSRHNEFQQGLLTTGQHGLQVSFESRLERLLLLAFRLPRHSHPRRTGQWPACSHRLSRMEADQHPRQQPDRRRPMSRTHACIKFLFIACSIQENGRRFFLLPLRLAVPMMSEFLPSVRAARLHLFHHLVQTEACRLLTRRVVLECRQEVADISLCRYQQEGAIEQPVIVCI
jgi:hypothetical protein